MKKQRGVRTAEGARKAALVPQHAQEAQTNAPSEDEIRERAFGIHIARGRPVGHDVDDWLQAERELTTRNGGNTSSQGS